MTTQRRILRGFRLFLIVFTVFGLVRSGYSAFSWKQEPIDPAVVAPAVQLGKAFVMVANHVRPTVVSVFSEKTIKRRSSDFPIPFGEDFFRQFFGDAVPGGEGRGSKQREFSIPLTGMGSGMILDTAGHVLTNYHVVNDVDRIKVQLADLSTFNAKVIEVDPNTDIAVIQMLGSFPKDLPPVVFGDSDKLQSGDLVIAIGAPFGLPQTVTKGIVSATGRSNVGIEDYEDFIQTDAAINPGNSGGPLANMNGEVIGLNTAIATGWGGKFSGVGFAIPSNLIKTMTPKLIRGEKIIRGQLGVVIQDLNPELAKQFKIPSNKGVLVAEVQSGTPAQKAGLKAGDVITRFADKEVGSATELRKWVSNSAPGAQVKLKILRAGKERSLVAVIGRQSFDTQVENVPEPEENSLDQIGMSVRDMGSKKGVLVSEVQIGSPAALAGILPGDVITEANHKSVRDIKDLQAILKRSKDPRDFLFLIKRKDISLFVAIQTG